MTDPAALVVTGWGWLRLAAGLAVLLLPGLAAVDRLFPGRRALLVLAPVLSLTLLPLAAILLDLLLQVPLHGAATVPLALALTLMLARPRVEAALRRAAR